MSSLLPAFMNARYQYVTLPDGTRGVDMTLTLRASEIYRLFDLAARVELDDDTARMLDELSEGQNQAGGGFWP